MSLNTATSGLAKGLPTNTDTINNIASDPVNQTTEQLNTTTQNVTDAANMPGDYPPDDQKPTPAPDISFSAIWSTIKNWVLSFLPSLADHFETRIKDLIAWLLPPPRQAKMYEAILSKPIASSFLICQLFCCGVPLLVFLAGVFLFAALAVLLWAVLALLLAGPILLVASMMGVSLWGWGWVLYGLVRFVDRHFLGGVVTRFWLANWRDRGEESGGEKGEGEEEEEKSEKPKKPRKLEVKKDA